MSAFDQMLAQVRDRTVIVDANLTVLKVFGDVRPKLIGVRRRTTHYTIQDHTSLSNALDAFARFGIPVLTTPHVLTEVSNLLADLVGRERLDAFGRFAQLLLHLGEISPPNNEIGGDPLLAEFGLTDVALMWLSTNGHLLLTDDGRLAAVIDRRGGAVWRLPQLHDAFPA